MCAHDREFVCYLPDFSNVATYAYPSFACLLYDEGISSLQSVLWERAQRSLKLCNGRNRWGVTDANRIATGRCSFTYF